MDSARSEVILKEKTMNTTIRSIKDEVAKKHYKELNGEEKYKDWHQFMREDISTMSKAVDEAMELYYIRKCEEAGKDDLVQGLSRLLVEYLEGRYNEIGIVKAINEWMNHKLKQAISFNQSQLEAKDKEMDRLNLQCSIFEKNALADSQDTWKMLDEAETSEETIKRLKQALANVGGEITELKSQLEAKNKEIQELIIDPSYWEIQTGILKSELQEARAEAERLKPKEERPVGFWGWLEEIGWDYDHKNNPSRWSDNNGNTKTEDELYEEYKSQGQTTDKG